MFRRFLLVPRLIVGKGALGWAKCTLGIVVDLAVHDVEGVEAGHVEEFGKIKASSEYDVGSRVEQLAVGQHSTSCA